MPPTRLCRDQDCPSCGHPETYAELADDLLARAKEFYERGWKLTEGIVLVGDLADELERLRAERDALRSVVRKAMETHPLEASSIGRRCWVRTVTAADRQPSLVVVTFTEAEHAAIDAAQGADQ